MTSYTDNLRLTLQALGENANTWGDVANNGFVERLEDAIAGFVSINLTGTGDYTLSVANGAYDEARNMILRLGGTPGAARNVIIPAASKMYLVECTVSASVSLTMKATGGVGCSLRPGSKVVVYCDGLDTFKITPTLTDFGITATAGELNILDGATLSTAELNVLDGITATVGELNILDGVTATTAEINILDGLTVTTAELNLLDGLTASAAELNILDGCTLTVGELNLLDGLTVSAGVLNTLASAASAGGSLVLGKMKIHVSGTGGCSVINKVGSFVTASTIAQKTVRVYITSVSGIHDYIPGVTGFNSGTAQNFVFCITSVGLSTFTFDWTYSGNSAVDDTILGVYLI